MSKTKRGSAATRRGGWLAGAIHVSNIRANETRRRVWVFSLREPANGVPRGSRAVPARETRCAVCHVPLVSSLRVIPRGGGLCPRGTRRRGGGTCQRGSQKPRHSEGASRSRSARESTRGGPTHRLKHAASLSLFLGQHPFQLSLLLHELLPQTQELLLLRGGVLLRRLGVGARHLGSETLPWPRKKASNPPRRAGVSLGPADPHRPCGRALRPDTRTRGAFDRSAGEPSLSRVASSPAGRLRPPPRPPNGERTFFLLLTKYGVFVEPKSGLKSGGKSGHPTRFSTRFSTRFCHKNPLIS